MNKPANQLESMLRSHPIAAPVRPDLATTTLKLAVQTQRIRLVRRWFAAAAAVSALLVLAKWLSNDALYLIQLAFTKAHLLREQTTLYTQAVWESLPQAQIITLLIIALLWCIWRRFETSLSAGRITGVKQGTIMKLIKFTPRLAITTGLLGAAALGVSGYTYAQKAQQHKLEILRATVNQSGRTELQTNLKAGECDLQKNPNATNKYEVKKSANLSPEDAKQVILAACELHAASTYLQHQNPQPSSDPTATSPAEYDLVQTGGFAGRIVSRDHQKLTIEMAYGPNNQTETLDLSPDATVYHPATGNVSASTLKPGTLVALSIKRHLVRTQHKVEGHGESSAYEPRSSKVIALYILPPSPDFRWYGKQHLLTPIEVCTGNPDDTCNFTGSIDFFPSGGGEGNVINSAFDNANKLPQKEIAGVITEITPTATTIKSSSGRLFTINFGSNPAAEFNRDRAQNYNNQQVKIGDTLMVRYAEAPDQHATTISQDRIFNAVLAIEFLSKSEAVKKY